MPRKPNSFRFQARNAIITFLKCPLPPNFILDYFLNLLRISFDLQYIMVAQEHHQDGDLHSHVMI